MTLEEIQKFIKLVSVIALSGFGIAMPLGIISMIKNNSLILDHNDYKKDIKNNEKEYEKELNDYNNQIIEYCNKIRNLNLPDLDIFIKLFDDLWKQIDGYTTVFDDVEGLERLYLKEKNKGCCRHFSDDLVAKLNYINPDYNARKVIVYTQKVLDNTYKLPIKRTILSTKPYSLKREEILKIIEEEIVKKYGAEYFEELIKSGSYEKYIEKYMNDLSETKEQFKEENGNHVVCAVDIPGKNISLMLDPTNNIIGYFKGKNIITFGGNKTGYKYIKKRNYVENKTKTFIRHELKANINNLISNKKINKLYGEEAQEKAYKNILYIDDDTNLGYSKTI